MLGKVIPRSAKAQIDLFSDQAHADDMTKLGLFSNLLPNYSRCRILTPANTIHQSSQPTLLTIHIRVAKRNAMNMSVELRASIDVASNPPDLSASPIAGGVFGFSISDTPNPRTQGCGRWKVVRPRYAQCGIECTLEETAALLKARKGRDMDKSV